MNAVLPLLLATALLLAGCDRVAALASVTPFASFESRCQALPPGRIDVVHVPTHATEVHTLANADLERLAEPTAGHHRTVGLTRAQFGYRSTLELDGLEDPRGGRACARPHVRVEVASSEMTVYVAREYRGDRCREPLILEHEHRHVAVFEGYGEEEAPSLARELDELVGAGVRYAPTMAQAQDSLKSELAAHLDAFMARARDELAVRHAAVDTDREYEKLGRTCGATADPVR